MGSDGGAKVPARLRLVPNEGASPELHSRWVHGWYIVPRGWMSDPVFKPGIFTEAQAFIWLMEEAGFLRHFTWKKGVRVTLERGELAASYRDLAVAFGWSEKRVRGFLSRMVTASKLTCRRADGPASAPSIIGICEYELFQHLPKVKLALRDAPEGAPGAHRRRGREQP